MIRRQLPVDLYKRCVTFLYGTTDEVNQFMKRLHPGEWDGLGVQCEGHWCVREHRGYQSDYIIVIQRPRLGTKRQIRDKLSVILSHEVFHCVSHNLRHAGLEHLVTSEEAYAYYLQYLFAECLQCLP